MNSEQLIDRNLQHLWHPCSQMKDFESLPPQLVTGAKGSYIYTKNGQRIIDAISSWWCKPLGHGHPRLRQALIQQAEQFEHVMLANLTHEPVIKLSEYLGSLRPGLEKILYASDGACAVEIAMKMSLHSRKIEQQKNKTEFMALSGAYHGETCGALSVSDLGVYRKPYAELLIDTTFINHVPYVSGKNDPCWDNSGEHWARVEEQLDLKKECLTAIIVEPIVQGANGMQIYSRDFLKRLHHWAKAHDVHIIADEIMTGLYRTGELFAYDYIDAVPDFMCLGKALTGGWLPLSAVITTNSIYELFYDDYELGKSFLHSHTYCGNPIAAAVALENMLVLEEEGIDRRLPELEKTLLNKMRSVAETTGALNNVRCIGGIVAADLQCDKPNQRLGYAVFQEAMQLGALLRPIGNTIYWLPPLNIEETVIDELTDITLKSIQRVCMG